MIAIFPELAGLAMAKDFERLACCVRKYFADEQLHKPVLNVDRISQKVGIRLRNGRADNHAALLIRDEKGQFEVSLIRSGESAGEAIDRALMAHLLGHFFIHGQLYIARNEGSRWGLIEKQFPHERSLSRPSASESLASDNALDWEADAFAYALLMPLGMVKRAKEKLITDDKVARFFGVPVEFAQARMSHLSIEESTHQTSYTMNSHLQETKMTKVSDKISQGDSERGNLAKGASNLSKGLQRLRQLARSMDSSVKL